MSRLICAQKHDLSGGGRGPDPYSNGFPTIRIRVVRASTPWSVDQCVEITTDAPDCMCAVRVVSSVTRSIMSAFTYSTLASLSIHMAELL